MKKYILRLCLCVVLLAALVLLTLLIRNKVDGFVKSKIPEQETKISATTAPTEEDTTKAPTKPGPTDSVDQSDPTGETEEGDETQPSGTTEPTKPTEETTKPTEKPTEPTEPPPSGQTAPAVAFYDSQGNACTLEAYKDKPIVLCFWASWATNSPDTLNLLQAAYNNYGDKVYFIAVNLTTTPRETEEAAKAFWASSSYSFPTYYDLDGTCRSAFGADTVPTTFFIKEENLAIAYFKGNLTRYGLTVGMNCILPKES